MKDFENWWHQEGSALHPLPTEDVEEFAKRITEIAWSNGIYKERGACANLVDENAKSCVKDSLAQMILYANATAIRAREN